MPFSIWRNGELLGSIVIPFRGDPAAGIAGILQPDAGWVDVAAIMQVQLEMLPGRPIIQTPPGHRSVEILRELTKQERRGISADRVLELRDDNDVVVPTKMIVIQTFQFPPLASEGEFPQACRDFGLQGTGWSVAAVFMDTEQ